MLTFQLVWLVQYFLFYLILSGSDEVVFLEENVVDHQAERPYIDL